MRILTGQTASGKSAIGSCLAGALGAELISVDSMKVYRSLDIGTAKPSPQTRASIRFHMVDVVSPAEAFSLAQFLAGAHAALADAQSRGRPVLFVGGTPLYLRGLLYGIFSGPSANWPLRQELMQQAKESGSMALYEELRRLDPVTAERLHPNDLVRVVRALEVTRTTGRPLSMHQRQYPAPTPAVSYRMAALRRSDQDMKDRINYRVDRMFDAGLINEVRAALEGEGLSRTARKAIGYSEVLRHLAGELSLVETVELVKRNTWRMARKQKSWLKSFPKLQWLDVDKDERPETTAERAREFLFEAEVN